jgi:addiction module RelE/StbE family toxin
VVKWTAPAKHDLKQIHDYIARDSKFYAKKVSLAIVENSEKLTAFPEIGRIVPEIGEPTIREIFVYSYRLIYEVLPAKIAILALIHGKRNFSYTIDTLRKRDDEI